MAEKAEFINDRRPITFIDLFAGAGGFSEGFLQSYTDDKYYDFILASDITASGFSVYASTSSIISFALKR